MNRAVIEVSRCACAIDETLTSASATSKDLVLVFTFCPQPVSPSPDVAYAPNGFCLAPLKFETTDRCYRQQQ